MGLRFNPAPGWPLRPGGFVPPPGWQPDPDWPPAPEGWQMWVDDGLPAEQAWPSAQPPSASPAWPGPLATVPPGNLSARAVTSLVLGVLGFFGITACLSIVFGAIALSNIRDRNLRGRGLAIGGIVLSGLWIAGLAGLIGLGITVGANNLAQSPVPAVSGGQSVNVFSLVPGDCFDNPTAAVPRNVSNVEQMACRVPHNAQIYATFKLTGSMFSYPGTQKTQSLAENGCNARIAASLDKSKVTNAMGIRFLFPVQGSWVAGHRTVSCMIVNPTPTLTTSLLKGSG